MCGRLNVIDDPWVVDLMEELGITLSITTNRDLRPTQPVATIAAPGEQLQQLDTVWGIQPVWAKRPLINAQAETVATKPTFRQAFAERRCLVPCSGFYEWRAEGGPRKQRYLFRPRQGGALMAALWYPGDTPGLVTLTREAPPEFAEYHHRFPVFIPRAAARDWVQASPSQAGQLLHIAGGEGFEVEPVYSSP